MHERVFIILGREYIEFIQCFKFLFSLCGIGLEIPKEPLLKRSQTILDAGYWMLAFFLNRFPLHFLLTEHIFNDLLHDLGLMNEPISEFFFSPKHSRE